MLSSGLKEWDYSIVIPSWIGKKDPRFSPYKGDECGSSRLGDWPEF